MKFISFLLLVASFELSAWGFSQGITLSVKNSSLDKVFKEVERQTDFRFVYSKEALELSRPVSLDVKNETVTNVLKLAFANQPLGYSIEEKFIIIKPDVRKGPDPSPVHDIKGKLVNENGEAVAGASIQVKGSDKFVVTDINGEFLLTAVNGNEVLLISGAEIESREIKLKNELSITVSVAQKVNQLNETIIKGYYNSSRRLNTGTVGKITDKDIATQPVSNPLATLQGRVSGLFITQANGLPGSGFSVIIRGRNSIQNGTSPLYIIDGVPFLSDADRLVQKAQFSASSPFNTINPGDIESIEVLKDADATAIYGSRGANGVILITTKKARAAKQLIDLSVYTGWGKVTRSMEQMNTAQYIAMRREAFKNDNRTPTNANAPDLLLWDTTRYVDWRELLIGGTAHVNNIQLKFSGGSKALRFSINSNLYRESTVFPGDAHNTRKSVNLNLNYEPEMSRFFFNVTVGYGSDDSRLYMVDLAQYINTVPNAPFPFDSLGRLNWSEKGASFSNPMAQTLRRYYVVTDRFSSGINMGYKFGKFITRVNLGYNSVAASEKTRFPIASQNPAVGPTASASFAGNHFKNWIAEPQIDYNTIIKRIHKISILAGASWQQQISDSYVMDASGYSTDNLLNSTIGAATVSSSALTGIYYRYQSTYARAGYTLADQYLVNITFRRDGSSRFGPGKRFGNFGSFAAGWIFTEQKLFKGKKTWLSYGKLKGSYGVVGNDQIGDYQYLDTWSGTTFSYQGIAGLYPTRITNPDYSWERKKNLDLSVELVFFKDRVFINSTFFRSISDNQIIQYTLPDQTGSGAILRNFPGVVENKGLELELTTVNIEKRNFEWKTFFNITSARNKLLKFPGLSSSSYASSYIIGQPTSIIMGLRYRGVDPQTGVYKFEDINKDGSINSLDYVYLGTMNPSLYGGLQNTIRIKNFSLQFLLQFVRQKGKDPIYGSTLRYGQQINQPVFITDRWQMPGNIKPYQQYTQVSSSPAWTPGSQIASSSAALVDASYIRGKNLSLSYVFSDVWIRKIKLQSARVYCEAQNLFTITKFRGTDPENQNRLNLPPIRMITFGVQITL